MGGSLIIEKEKNKKRKRKRKKLGSKDHGGLMRHEGDSM